MTLNNKRKALTLLGSLFAIILPLLCFAQNEPSMFGYISMRNKLRSSFPYAVEISLLDLKETFKETTHNGNCLLFNYDGISLNNLTPLTGIKALSFNCSNEYVCVSSGYKEGKYLYERFEKNDGTNQFSLELKDECYFNLFSLNGKLKINNLKIYYSCSMLKDEIYDSDLDFFYDINNESYSVGVKSTTIAKNMETVLIPRYFDDGVNGEHLVTTIKEGGFNACSATNVYIPSTIIKIESQGFYQNTKVKHIFLPDSIMEIGTSSFNKCTSLENIRLSENLFKIGASSFKECSSLKEIYIPDSVSSLEETVFSTCSVLSKVNCPRGITALPGSLFYYDHALVDFTITKNIKDVGYRSFKNCNNIENIYYEGTIQDFSNLDHSKTFYSSCPKLSVVHCSDGDFTL